MNRRPALRAKARHALERYFRSHSLPRVTLGLLLVLTAAAGFFASVVLLHYGVDSMAVRYPIAAAMAYGVFLGLIRLWVEIERARFNPKPGEIERLAGEGNPGTPRATYPGSSNRGSWLDWLDVSNAFDLDDGCLPALMIGAIVALAVLVFTAIANAPAFMAEVFLDAFIVSVLYRRLRIAAKEHWLGTAIRKTWLHVVLTIVLLCVVGGCLDWVAPGARSIGPALRHFWRG